MKDATFGASKVFGGAYFREQCLERRSAVWSLKWFCRHLLVGLIFTSRVSVCLEKRRGDVGVMYILGIYRVYLGKMERRGGGVVWFWRTSEVVEGD